MQWPVDWIVITLGGKQVYAGPNEYVNGLFHIVTQWQDEALRVEAFELLAQILQPGQYPEPEYRQRTELLAVATVYASIGITAPDACGFCIDTLEELVP